MREICLSGSMSGDCPSELVAFEAALGWRSFLVAVTRPALHVIPTYATAQTAARIAVSLSMRCRLIVARYSIDTSLAPPWTSMLAKRRVFNLS